MVVEARLEHSVQSAGTETLTARTESSVWYQLLVAVTQTSVRLKTSPRERKVSREALAVGEVASVELLPWRRFFDSRVNTRYANGWHVLSADYRADLLVGS